jgi:8-oxo-dGTP pyrophosphatase MutT (NUDIX family)/nicotinamide riboside kinase
MKKEFIAIAGAHGTGKTTLTQQLQQSLHPAPYGFSQVKLISDVARECPYSIGAKSNYEAQNWIFEQQYLHETQTHGIVLADNCLLVHYAYYEYWVGKDEIKLRMALDAFREYDSILLLPLAPQLCKADDLRPGDLEFQNEMDIRIRRLVALSGRTVHILPDLSCGNRETLALEIINSRLEKKYLNQIPIVLGLIICEEYLLISRRVDDIVPLAHERWNVIERKIEFGEQPQDALQQECYKETGIQVNQMIPIPLPTLHVWENTSGRFQSIIFGYICYVNTPLTNKPSFLGQKISELKWVNIKDLSNYNFPPSVKPYLEYIQRRMSP